jgi:hypothetical protein
MMPVFDRAGEGEAARKLLGARKEHRGRVAACWWLDLVTCRFSRLEAEDPIRALGRGLLRTVAIRAVCAWAQAVEASEVHIEVQLCVPRCAYRDLAEAK